MAEPASDYHRGDMDIRAQADTFHTFMKITKWFCLYLAAILLFFIMWLSAHTGILPALITAVIVTVLGTLLLSEKGGSGH